MAYHSDLDTTLARYADAWNTTEADDRWALVHACATDRVVYTDPHSEKPVQGQPSLVSFMGYFQTRTGWRFAFTDSADGHHEWIRAPWALFDGEETKATGVMIARLAPDVRLEEIVHFVD